MEAHGAFTHPKCAGADDRHGCITSKVQSKWVAYDCTVLFLGFKSTGCGDEAC